MSGIEVFIIFFVVVFFLPVVFRGIRADKLMLYATLFESSLNQCGRRVLRMSEAFSKF